MLERPKRCYISVSYTHLDVYKRQALMVPKTTRTTQGVNVLTMKPKYRLDHVCLVEESGIRNLARYRGRNTPAAGALVLSLIHI